jgi:hypothetical protein
MMQTKVIAVSVKSLQYCAHRLLSKASADYTDAQEKLY